MEKIPLSQIKQSEKNPRFISPSQLEKLKSSISEFSEMMEARGIVCDRDDDGSFVALGGNQRLAALEALGYTEIPKSWIFDASGWSEEKKREFVIKDNVGFGEWDWDALQEEYTKEELEGWGMEEGDILFDGLEEEEEAKEMGDDILPKIRETTIVEGDIIGIFTDKGELVGKVACGDSTDYLMVQALFDGEKADMAFNDPPYGMMKEGDGVANDNLNFDDLVLFNKLWIAAQFDILRDGGSFYCWGIDEPLMDIYAEILKPMKRGNLLTFRQIITWRKTSTKNDKEDAIGMMTEAIYQYPVADEKCLFAVKGVHGFNDTKDFFFEGYKQIQEYLNSAVKNAKIGQKEVYELTGKKEMFSHWFSNGSQWSFIKSKDYKVIQKAYPEAFYKKYAELEAEYMEAKKEFKKNMCYFCNTNEAKSSVWSFHRNIWYKDEGFEIDHATPKPIALCERGITSSCPEGGLVTDFFLGSGSTMVASLRTGRRCFGIELQPQYCQQTIERVLHNLPSYRAEKIN